MLRTGGTTWGVTPGVNLVQPEDRDWFGDRVSLPTVGEEPPINTMSDAEREAFFEQVARFFSGQ